MSPQRIHHMLPDQGGQDVMETLCNILVVPVRNPDEHILYFYTLIGENPIQCMFDERGVSCNVCQKVWNSLRPKIQVV